MSAVLLYLSLASAGCAPADHACKAEDYVSRAKRGDQATRVQRLYLAHREYLYLFDGERKPEILCRARKVLAEALEIQPTPAHLVERLKTTGDDAAKREGQAGVSCPPSGGVKKTETRVALKQRPQVPRAPEKDAPEIARAEISPPTVSAEPEPQPIELSTPPPLLPVQHHSVRAPEQVASERPVVVGAGDQAPPPPPRPADRRPRARVGGGVALLVVSAGLAGGMGVALQQRGELVRTLRALEASIEREGRDATPAEYTREARLNQEYGALTFAAGFTGAASGIAAIVGVVLLAKRPRPLVALPWSGPRIAGITLRGHF